MNGARIDGGAEFTGLIQVTDLNSIEHWTSGKLEFSIYVYSATGLEVSSRKFPKVKRKYFRDQQWYDFNHSIGNWNKATFGNWMVENWWERDRGGTKSTTITIPPANGGPGVAFTLNNGDRDDNLGKAVVQFTDPITQLYQISYMNFKRKF